MGSNSAFKGFIFCILLRRQHRTDFDNLHVDNLHFDNLHFGNLHFDNLHCAIINGYSIKFYPCGFILFLEKHTKVIMNKHKLICGLIR